MKYFLAGMLANFATGFDDMFSRIPIVTAVTRTRMGRIAFAFGNLLAVALVVATASYVGHLVAHLWYFRFIVAGVIILMAFAIYYDRLRHREQSKKEDVIKLYQKRISLDRALGLMGAGFVVSLLTLIDDSVVYIPLFAEGRNESAWAIAGIMVVAIIQVTFVIFFAEKLSRIKYRRRITAAALLIYAALILAGIV